MSSRSGEPIAPVAIFSPVVRLRHGLEPFIPKLRAPPWAAGFLDGGANTASLALMAAATAQLGPTVLVDWVAAGHRGWCH